MILTKDFRFEASHQLPNHDGKCARLHGHSWKLIVAVEGNVNQETGHPKEGMVLDYTDIKTKVEPIIEALDHHHLGSGIAFSDGVNDLKLGPDTHLLGMRFPKVPTSENILIWIAAQIGPEFPWTQLQLEETCTCAAILDREEVYL